LTKLRVYEYAKQLNMSSKEILTILNRLDVPVANHMSVMDEKMVQKVEQFFSDVKQRAAQKHATELERELREKQRQRERAARQEQALRADSAPAGEGAKQRTPGDGIVQARPARVERTVAKPQMSSGVVASTQGEDEQKLNKTTEGNIEGRATVRMETGKAAGEIREEKQTEATAEAVAEKPVDSTNRRPARETTGGTNGNRPYNNHRGDRRPSDGRTDRRPGGYTNGTQRDGRANGSSTGGTNARPNSSGDRDGRYGRAGQQSSSGSGSSSSSSQGSRFGQGGHTGGNYGRDNRGGQGGSRDRNSSSGYSSGGAHGNNRTDRGTGNRSGYGNSGGSGFSGRNGSGPRGGSGGRPQGRPANSGMMAVAAKPTAPGSLRKDKDKVKTREDFSRDRKERFNEDKLTRQTGRKRPNNATRHDVKKPEVPLKVSVEGAMPVGDFAKLIKREPSEIIKKLLFLGIMATINQEIDTDAMELIAGEYNVELTVVEPVDEEALDMLVEDDNPLELMSRPPVVTIMGHVDHGKTTLLDAFRESKVTATESGGITQHIGAYQVEVNNRMITFLDTPGHEAFTTMRARGAQVTDVTILVVAADDGVMPQTVEAINHAKAANVPIIVAVNKIDKPNANQDRVKQELMQYGLVPEEWGGETVCVPISALKREGLKELLEMVLLVSDMGDFKANPKARPRGTVIEAKLDKGRGPVATVLVQNGTLKVGNIIVAGTAFGHVRAMVNDNGKRLKLAGPSTPVEIQGLGEVPSAGDLFVVYDDERAARNLVHKRLNRERAEQMQQTARVTLDDLYRQIKEGNMKDLNVIVKADVQGSVEALVQSIEKIDVEGVRVKVIHRGAGAITESDVALADASNAIIIGFHVRPDVNAKRAAEENQVDIRLYRVIYNAIDELESAMKGLLDPEYKEVVLGHAEVRQTFTISKVGTVAGCYVVDGKMTRDAEARLVRDGIVVYEGNLDTLKRFKDDAREVATGFECGITLERYNDIKVGDVIEAFKMEALKAQ
jgi:translation initiation factor IF-2